MTKTSLASFPYLKMHQKIRIFASTRSQLYRRIFRFFLHFRLEYVPISPQKLKISPTSSNKWWKIFTQSAKNAILTKIFDVEKKIYFFYFCNMGLDLGPLWMESKGKLKKFVDTEENEPIQNSSKFMKISSKFHQNFMLKRKGGVRGAGILFKWCKLPHCKKRT